MVEKIIVNGKVRALGNIVEEKILSDYETNALPLTESTDTVDGKTIKVYHMPPILFADYAVTSNQNDNWDNWGSYTVTRTRGNLYTLISPNDSTTASYQIKYIDSLWDVNCIEFDAKQVGGATSDVLFQLRGPNQSVIRQVSLDTFGGSLGVWYHYIFDFVNSTITNTTVNSTVTFNPSSVISFFFSIPANSGHTIHYANFSISDTGIPPLFYDSGISGTKNDQFVCTKTEGNYTVTTNDTGTTFLCNGSDGFYIPNIDIHEYSDLEIRWIFTYGTRFACHVSLLDSNKANSNGMRWHNKGETTPSTDWYNPSGSTSISHTLTAGDHMRLIKSNNTFTLYCNNVSLGSGTPNYDVHYIGLTSADGNRPFGYKGLKIKRR